MANLDIFIVTYNRSSYLKNTLFYLSKSKFKQFDITVLDNCSTDDTRLVCEQFKNDFVNLSIITHRNNVGANANITRAFELSSAKYTWVLCDDDDYNFEEIDDVLEIIEKGEVDLIHVGSHPGFKWICSGTTASPNQLLENGYHYFRSASFLPCNIFKTETLQKQLISAYNNIGNAYPHMPYVFDVYKRNAAVYLTINQLVTAKIGDGYSASNWLIWWLNTSKLLNNKEDTRLVFFDHFEGEKGLDWMYSLMTEVSLTNVLQHDALVNFVKFYFNTKEANIFFSSIRKLKFEQRKQLFKNQVKRMLSSIGVNLKQ